MFIVTLKISPRVPWFKTWVPNQVQGRKKYGIYRVDKDWKVNSGWEIFFKEKLTFKEKPTMEIKEVQEEVYWMELYGCWSNVSYCRYCILYPFRLGPPFPKDIGILKPKVGLGPN